jgi:hypothetical protein
VGLFYLYSNYKESTEKTRTGVFTIVIPTDPIAIPSLLIAALKALLRTSQVRKGLKGTGKSQPTNV